MQACDSCIQDKKIAVLGLTFKPIRMIYMIAPALTIITDLQEAGAFI